MGIMSTKSDLNFPRELTEPVRDVLKLMNFQTCPIAHLFQQAGHDIPRRCEAEQAFVLHWLLTLALEHGEQWKVVAQRRLDALHKEIKLLSEQPPKRKEKP